MSFSICNILPKLYSQLFPLRRAAGAMPKCFLNARLKWLMSQKPAAAAVTENSYDAIGS